MEIAIAALTICSIFLLALLSSALSVNTRLEIKNAKLETEVQMLRERYEPLKQGEQTPKGG